MSDASDHSESTTIVAVATPPGRGGIGVVRCSGEQALRIAGVLFPAGLPLKPRMASYRILRGPDGERMDDALVTYFAGPQSYTGEDVVEIAIHSSPVVLDWLVRTCVEYGATPARPGEFTERAFLSGRVDLTAAEAVRDLIEAQTLAQATLAAEQMGGSIAQAIRPGKESLLQLIAALEAGIDFAEDDLETMPHTEVERRIRLLLPPLNELLASFTHGRLLRDGLRLAIVGQPNVGKSSLFNRLVEQDRAIITAVPGTTRDIISEYISLGGMPVTLLDTAGLRETTDEAERLGVARSRQAIAEADAVLVVVDATNPVGIDNEAYGLLSGRPVLIVQNKVDLLPAEQETAMARKNYVAAVEDLSQAIHKEARIVVKTSTLSGQGIPELRRAIVSLATGGTSGTAAATLTNLRQQKAVSCAHAALLRAVAASALGTPHELILLDLYESLQAQDELTGQTTPDDVLNLIFSTFCIGK